MNLGESEKVAEEVSLKRSESPGGMERVTSQSERNGVWVRGVTGESYWE